MSMLKQYHIQKTLVALTVVAIVSGVLYFGIVVMAPVRGAVASYTDLVSAANLGDLDAARSLCTAEYLARNPLTLAPEGGIVGLPRNIHKNYQAWRDGPHVLICPTGRTGPIYEFVYEQHQWRFNGPVGLLGSNRQIAFD